MKFLVLFLFILLSCNQVLAFDIETVDETKEGIEKANKKAQEIIRASDGKVIVKTMPKTILKPIKVTIIQGYKPIVEPFKRKIIYPIGAIPPKSIEKEIKEPVSTPPKQEENIFLSSDSDSINDKSADELKINIDTDFKKSLDTTTAEKPKTIAPVNIE